LNAGQGSVKTRPKLSRKGNAKAVDTVEALLFEEMLTCQLALTAKMPVIFAPGFISHD
jgi:hypothetical protein